MLIRNYFRPSNGLSEPTGSISVALKSREQGTSSPPCARSAEYFLHPVTVHSIVATSPSQKQRTAMPFEANVLWWFLFHCHSVSIGSVFGVSFALQRLSNRRLPYFFIYVVASNATFPFEKLFHGSYFLCTFLPPALAALLQTLCCKIFVGHRPYENFFNKNFI